MYYYNLVYNFNRIYIEIHKFVLYTVYTILYALNLNLPFHPSLLFVYSLKLKSIAFEKKG